MDKMRARRGEGVGKAREMLGDIDEAQGVMGGIELNDWEEEFIESIETQLDGGRTLSPNQLEKLEQIWNKV